MRGRFKKKFRLECVFRSFGKSVFFTLTVPDRESYFEIRDKWRLFRNSYSQYLRRRGVKLRYAQVFEPHPNGHGWHIHVVFDTKFLDIHQLRHYSLLSGFGRIHIEKVRSNLEMEVYLSKYLVKAQVFGNLVKTWEMSNLRVRLMNVSRGCTRLSDIESECDIDSYVNRLIESGLLDGCKVFMRWKIAFQALFYFPLVEFYVSDKVFSLLKTSEFLSSLRTEFKANLCS